MSDLRDRNLAWTGNHFLSKAYLRTAARGAIRDVDLSGMGSADSAPLRKALGNYYGLPPEWFAIGNGSSQVLSALVSWFSDHHIIDIVPNFGMTAITANRIGASYSALRVRNRSDLLPALKRMISGDKEVVVLSSPRNPFGYAFTNDELLEAASLIRGHLIVDQAYVEFADGDRMHALLDRPNIIIVRTFSKAWGLANLRLGYAVWPGLPKNFSSDYLLPWNVGEIGQNVAIALLTDPKRVSASVLETKKARDGFIARLSLLPGVTVWQSDANFLCVEVPDVDLIQLDLSQHGIHVANVRGMRTYPPDWPDALRIAVGRKSILEMIARSCEKFGAI